MRTSLPPAVFDAVGNPLDTESDYWFDQDLTLEELRRTVALINSVMRSARN